MGREHLVGYVIEMQKINSLGLEIIKNFEGFSPRIYFCPAGYKTIGYGHKLLAGENFELISKIKAEELLIKDLIIAENAVHRLVYEGLNDNQFSALVSFVFNLGSAAFQRSTLRQKINYSESINDICYEFLRWCYCNGKYSKGLYKRRVHETQLYSLY